MGKFNISDGHGSDSDDSIIGRKKLKSEDDDGLSDIEGGEQVQGKVLIKYSVI